MDNEKVVNYIESSFISALLKDENVTDISFNGSSLYYLHNLEGRKKSDIQISNSDAKDFVRQVANITEKQFSFQSPILDVSAGRYRLNAVHNSIARFEETESILAVFDESQTLFAQDAAGVLEGKSLERYKAGQEIYARVLEFVQDKTNAEIVTYHKKENLTVIR